MDHHHLRLRHPMDPHHALYLRELSQHFSGDTLQCEHCGGDIHNGSVYCCEECKIFMHKPCAEAPCLTQIEHHPCHPQHPLTLQMTGIRETREADREHEYGADREIKCCFLCGRSIYERWAYKCESYCGFSLHASCLVATLPDNKDEVDGATLKHMEHIHVHPLSSLVVKSKHRFRCHGCEEYSILGEAWMCYECGIFFHDACTDLVQKIQRHPFHPQHPLELISVSDRDLRYSCKECNNVAFNVPTMISTLPQKEDDVREEESRSAMNHFVHEHPLNPYLASTPIWYYCNACDKRIVNGFYGCIDCHFLIHKSCAEAPSEIQHYLHTNHPLSLVSKLEDTHEPKCGNCTNHASRGFAYRCQTCNFTLHMNCALKTLAYLDEGATTTIQHFSHKHELTLHHGMNLCYGCNELREGPEYRCRKEDCKFCIHKSCLELPSIIRGSSHSHPLTLNHEESNNQFNCCACGRKRGHFKFSCAECKLNFDVVCAFSVRPTLKEHLHKHDLFYLAELWEASPCKVCGKQCTVDLFHCGECRVCVHYDCVHLLSKIMKSNFHVDPLTLYDSVVEDGGGEYYCDICEGVRDRELWVYYCSECEFIAHVKCATSLVRLKPVKENPKLKLERLDIEIKCVREEMDAKEEIRSVMEKLLAAQREELKALKTKFAEVMCFGVVHHPRHPHPLHPDHALYLRQLSELFYCNARLECKHCYGDICDGSVYCCEICMFFLHKPCAEAPPLTRIQHHPYHPQHPLTLRIPEGKPYCSLCMDTYRNSSWFYNCESCSYFNLHPDCAVATLPDNEDEVDCARLQHKVRIHKHPLSFLAKLKAPFKCCQCCDVIIREAYLCYQCGIFFHKSCIDGPQEIQHHPFHCHHPLELIFNDSGLRYSCKECNNVAFKVPTLISTLPQKEDDDVREEESRFAINHFAHKHPLNPYHAATEIKYDCKACDKRIVNGFYGCIDCRFLVHESCAKAPSEIQHYLHANHPLCLVLLQEDAHNPKCGNCTGFLWRGFAYHCQTCSFALHMVCALKTLAYLEEGATATIQHYSHQHELTLHDLNRESCYGCGMLIEGLGYRCCKKDCRFFIHKSCLELPSVIRGSSHSHPLTLSHEESNDQFNCCVCGGKYGHFKFSCADCELNFHVVCAFSKRPTLKEHPHKHDLFFKAIFWNNSPCKVCGKQCTVDLFHCGECGIRVHNDCIHLLPKTIVSHHVDTLILCESIFEDDSEENCCDICEGRRNPELWAYYCEECKFIAHVKCAISPVKLESKKEMAELRQLEKQIECIPSQLVAMEASVKETATSLEALREKLETLKTNRKELAYQNYL